MRKTFLATTILLASTTLCFGQDNGTNGHGERWHHRHHRDNATASTNFTVVKAGDTGSIVDASGDTWSIVSGIVQKNGKPAGYSKNVTQITYVDGAVWQQNAAGLWWRWDGNFWPGYGTSTSPLPVPVAPASGPATPSAAAPMPTATAPPSLATPAPPSPISTAPAVAAAVAPMTPPITTTAPTPCPTASGGTGAFSVANGQIIGPNGQPFVARGINITNFGNLPSLGQVQAAFPGVNFIRLAIYQYDSPSSLSPWVTAFTQSGIVVELEDHTSSDGQNRGGGTGEVFSGQQLATELAWYQSVAAAFASNPYVWFGTDNEPSEVPSAAALSQWQAQTVQAIRGTGNNSIVMIEMNSDATNLCGSGYTPAAYAGMKNVVWDMHYYNWIAGYSTDQAAISNQIGSLAQSAQQITSADGVMPVLIGEYGNSTSGAAIDPGGTETVAAVINAGSTGVTVGGAQQRLGSSAWSWGTGGPGDGLTTSDGAPSTPYGQMVKLYTNTSTVAPTQCQVDQQAAASVAAALVRAQAPQAAQVAQATTAAQVAAAPQSDPAAQSPAQSTAPFDPAAPSAAVTALTGQAASDTANADQIIASAVKHAQGLGQ